MPCLGITENMLKKQLNEWLALSLDAALPSSLLILSRAFSYVGMSKVASTEEALKATLSTLPEKAVEVLSESLRKQFMRSANHFLSRWGENSIFFFSLSSPALLALCIQEIERESQAQDQNSTFAERLERVQEAQEAIEEEREAAEREKKEALEHGQAVEEIMAVEDSSRKQQVRKV